MPSFYITANSEKMIIIQKQRPGFNIDRYVNWLGLITLYIEFMDFHTIHTACIYMHI